MRSSLLLYSLICTPDSYHINTPRPRPLELTATDEILATENIDVLRANGFEISIDEEADRSQGDGRVKLIAQPVSGSTSFDMRGSSSFLIFAPQTNLILNVA